MDAPAPSSLTTTNLLATVRHLLTAGAGALVATGLISQDCVNSISTNLSTGVATSGGVVAFAATVGWSFYQKWSAAKVQSAPTPASGVRS